MLGNHPSWLLTGKESSRKRISHKSKYLLLVYILSQCLEAVQGYIQKGDLSCPVTMDQMIYLMGILANNQITQEFFKKQSLTQFEKEQYTLHNLESEHA